jgi:hypothetical protein
VRVLYGAKRGRVEEKAARIRDIRFYWTALMTTERPLGWKDAAKVNHGRVIGVSSGWGVGEMSIGAIGS